MGLDEFKWRGSYLFVHRGSHVTLAHFIFILQSLPPPLPQLAKVKCDEGVAGMHENIANLFMLT